MSNKSALPRISLAQGAGLTVPTAQPQTKPVLPFPYIFSSSMGCFKQYYAFLIKKASSNITVNPSHTGTLSQKIISKGENTVPGCKKTENYKLKKFNS